VNDRISSVELVVAPGPGPGARRAFTLVELLVVISIIMTLIGIVAAGASAARTSSRRQATQSLIGRLDTIIQEQFATYASRPVTMAVTGTTASGARAAALRLMATGDMPDSWADVQHMASNPSQFTSAPQRAYIAFWNSRASSPPSASFGDAECLFMIVMQGGIASCIDCGELRTTERGDADSDNAFEFLDAWGNPIRFILWPGDLQLPPSSGIRFFSSTAPFTPNATGRTMRPLIVSGGPDETNSVTVNGGSNLSLGVQCGVPASSPFGGRDTSSGSDGRADNITNFDSEVSR
jgi:type II secretory pathway pseudopilin PulG